jgi:predicted transcriptional regulator
VASWRLQQEGQGVIRDLPRREREIFEILCSAGEATAAQVRETMDDPPSYSAVRTMLGRLEGKGLVKHRVQDQAYVYKSVPQPAKIRESALQQMVKTFFNGSAASAATALLGLSKAMKPEELDALQKLIDEAKERQS